MSDDRLIRMANKIAEAFAASPHDQAVAATAEHIRRYWDPRMRAKLKAHLDQGAAGLEPLALAAAHVVTETPKAEQPHGRAAMPGYPELDPEEFTRPS